MKNLGLLTAILAILEPFVNSAAICNGENYLESTFRCMVDINQMVYEPNACSLQTEMWQIVTDCLSVPPECENDVTFQDYIIPEIDRTRLQLNSLQISCTNNPNGLVQQGRTTCTYATASSCVSTFGPIAAIPPISMDSIFSVCNSLNTYRVNLQTCKTFTSACLTAVNDNLASIMPTLDGIINYLEEMQQKGCDCATKVYNCSVSILGSNICEDIRRGSACALVAADSCAKQVTFIFVTVSWLDLTVTYLRTYLFFVPTGCEVVAVGINLFSKAPFLSMSILLLILMLTVIWTLRKFRHH